MRYWSWAIGALLLIVATIECSTRNDLYYTAGVVEFRPVVSGMSSADMVSEHLAAYLEIIRSPEARDTDIIVFPEGTLNNALQTSLVPAARDQVIPCEAGPESEYADFLVQFSCAARAARKYLVINLTERERCSAAAADTGDPRPCAANDLNVYNTNVVFDRRGQVVSRYRKVHTYLEDRNTTLQPGFGVFDTDFGVRFGHFICFDMLFYTPAEELVRRHGLSHFIFTSWFYSELPFLTAVQMQQSWAWGNGVNLLAAGASFPAAGITGSGIYAGRRGQLRSVMADGAGVRQLLVATLPKVPDAAFEAPPEDAPPAAGRQTDVKLMRDPQVEHFTSELLDFVAEPHVVRDLCDGAQCCHFEVRATPVAPESEPEPSSASAVHYRYRIGVYAGNRTYEKQEWSNLRICALYACANASAASCGQLLPPQHRVAADVAFTAVSIEGGFAKADRLLISPTSLDDRLYPLSQAVEWSVEEERDQWRVQLALHEEHQDLLSFGIYANYYDRSGSSRRAAAIVLQGLLLWFAVWRWTTE